MDSISLLIFLCVVAAMAGVLVWLITRVQEQHRAHYSAMIAVAGARGLKFSDDPDQAIRLRLEGEVEGVKIRVLSRVSGQRGHRGPTTEVHALRSSGLPKGSAIEFDPETGRLVARGERESNETASMYLRDRHFRQAMEAVASSQLGGAEGTGFLDDRGVHITAACLVHDEQVLGEMISRALNVTTVLSQLLNPVTPDSSQ